MVTTSKPTTEAVQPIPQAFPTYTFETFAWTANDIPLNETGCRRDLIELSNLVDHVKDVASGAALVFELMSAHDCDVDSQNQSYMSPYHLALLRRMATRSLEVLDEKASEIARRMTENGGGL
jgi:hypothetical protein